MAAYLKGTLACHGRIVDVGSVAPNGSFWDGWQQPPLRADQSTAGRDRRPRQIHLHQRELLQGKLT